MHTDFVSIDKYLSLICSLLIDQFNLRYKHFDRNMLQEEANKFYLEQDWVYRIGEPFKELAHYEVPGERGRQSHHDIGIPSKDFLIEVKYMKNWKSASKHRTASMSWELCKKDLLWLGKELEYGYKGKRAVVFIWFNCVDYLGQIVQLGEGKGTGSRPLASPDKLAYFPYLTSKGKKAKGIHTDELVYDYAKEYPCQVDLSSTNRGNVNMDCLFLGKPEDKLHIAIYY